MIKNRIKGLFDVYKNINCSKASLMDDKFWLSRNLTSLTEEEEREVDSLWGRFPHVRKEWVRKYHRAYKTFLGFNKQYVPGCVYYPYILRSLNPKGNCEIFENKALFTHYIPVTQPSTVFKRISAVWYDGNNQVVNNKRVLPSILEAAQKTELIFKPAQDTCCGRGIEFFNRETTEGAINQLIAERNSDLIIQQVVQQSQTLSRLNPTSLNCLRINTLNLNGDISVANKTIKIGGKGLKVDNIGGGHGGSMFGVNDEGKLTKKGFTNNALLVLPEELLSFVVPNLQEILKFAVAAHRCLPHIGLVGWDIALNEDDRPVMIEANMWWPGAMLEQISGPFFGERTEEVMEFVRSKFRNKTFFNL